MSISCILCSSSRSAAFSSASDAPCVASRESAPIETQRWCEGTGARCPVAASETHKHCQRRKPVTDRATRRRRRVRALSRSRTQISESFKHSASHSSLTRNIAPQTPTATCMATAMAMRPRRAPVPLQLHMFHSNSAGKPRPLSLRHRPRPPVCTVSRRVARAACDFSRPCGIMRTWWPERLCVAACLSHRRIEMMAGCAAYGFTFIAPVQYSPGASETGLDACADSTQMKESKPMPSLPYGFQTTVSLHPR